MLLLLRKSYKISRIFTNICKTKQKKWVSDGLIDELYIWFRTTNNLDEVSDGVDNFVRKIKDRCPVIAEFSSYHPGSFQDGEEILKASSIAKSKGAYSVGIYKALWFPNPINTSRLFFFFLKKKIL